MRLADISKSLTDITPEEAYDFILQKREERLTLQQTKVRVGKGLPKNVSMAMRRQANVEAMSVSAEDRAEVIALLDRLYGKDAKKYYKKYGLTDTVSVDDVISEPIKDLDDLPDEVESDDPFETTTEEDDSDSDERIL